MNEVSPNPEAKLELSIDIEYQLYGNSMVPVIREVFLIGPSHLSPVCLRRVQNDLPYIAKVFDPCRCKPILTHLEPIVR